MPVHIWFTPLILLPGIALILMSATHKHGVVSGVLRSTEYNSELFCLLLRRVKLLEMTLYFLYVSIIFFCCASIFTFIFVHSQHNLFLLMSTLSIIACILSIFVPSVLLIIDTHISWRIVKDIYAKKGCE